MQDHERKSLAEQLLSNPVFQEIMADLEQRALEALVYADTEQKRVEAQWRVRAIRSFETDCEAIIRNTRS